jgi:8-oxo-dGTP diphosphatase
MTTSSPPCIRIRVAGVLSENGKVLLVCHEKENKKYWLLPGGGVDFGESLEKALVREFLEETSIHIRVGRLLMINEVIAPDGSRHGLHFTFLVKRISGELKANPDERLRLAEFVKWENIPHLAFFPNIKEKLFTLYQKRFRTSIVFTGNIWIP